RGIGAGITDCCGISVCVNNAGQSTGRVETELSLLFVRQHIRSVGLFLQLQIDATRSFVRSVSVGGEGVRCPVRIRVQNGTVSAVFQVLFQIGCPPVAENAAVGGSAVVGPLYRCRDAPPGNADIYRLGTAAKE